MGELEQEIERRGLGSGKKEMLVLVAVVAVGSLAYGLLVTHHLEQTALLFIGIPALLATLLALAPPAKSLVGGVVKGISFMLLLSGPLLGEGFICVLMAAPIFLFVGVLVAALVEHSKKQDRPKAISCCLLLLIPMSLEGTTERFSFGRDEQVTVSAVVAGSEQAVRERMAKSPNVGLKLPAYLRMGFPHPASAVGEGLATGDMRTIHFAGGEGMPGDLVMRVKAATGNSAQFEVASDTCEGMHSVGHWVKLREADVRWDAVDANHTKVTWSIAYERRLDPAWYFGPWERYGVRLAAHYLIDANAGVK